MVVFHLENATGILTEIASRFRDPRILLLYVERRIDYQFLAPISFRINCHQFKESNQEKVVEKAFIVFIVFIGLGNRNLKMAAFMKQL